VENLVKKFKMPGPRRKRKTQKRLDLVAGGVLPATVPKRWVKMLVGFFLLIPCGILAQTFFNIFAKATVHQGFWMSEEFWFFSLGVILWIVAFAGLPRPLWLYVFGHELTHALWVLMLGGRIHRFQVSRSGGHILADRTNTWIALAPYFFPIYSVLVIGIYGGLALFMDMAPYRQWLFGLIGVTWAFHLTFTCWMIPKGQPDLHYGGTFFSIVLIAFLNLMVLSLMLIVASPQVTWLGFGRELVGNAMEFTVGFTLLLNHMLR